LSKGEEPWRFRYRYYNCFLTPNELNKFLDTAKSIENITNYTVALLLAYTDVRRGEALGLKWKHINFKRIIIIQVEDE